MVPGALIAEIIRGNEVESRHIATIVLLGSDGTITFTAGDPTESMIPRSAIKPLQAVGMLMAGLAIDAELLALVSASHIGSPYHVALVDRLLRQIGLCLDDLRNPPTLPLGVAQASAVLRTGSDLTPAYSPCSGKHAGMLATCRAADWSIESYEQATHPLQRHLRAVVEEITGVTVTSTLPDGCGAPTFGLPLVALARAFRRLVVAEPGTARRQVADAMRAYPDVVGGEGRAVTTAMRVLPGLLAKDGAEGVLAMALPDGRAAALKVHDGADRAVGPALLSVLDTWSLVSPKVYAELSQGFTSPSAATIRYRPLRPGGAVGLS